MTQAAGSLRILITNNTAAARAGSELYVRDLAMGLLRRGHRPVVYSSVLGEVAELLRRATIPVVDDLDALGYVPDLIHGQHHLEAMTAILRFPQVPAVYVCHGWMPWEEMPPVHPAIQRYIAVDDLCGERLLTTLGIDAARIATIYNGVDLARFRPRAALPPQPRSALVFSNYALATGFAETIRAACLSQGLTRVDVVGLGVGEGTTQPEALLGDYDIVFAKARCALEAMAVGCATVVADGAGLAGLVDMHSVADWRRLNFGMRTMQHAVISQDSVVAQLQAYSPEEAARVSAWIRGVASFDTVVERLLEIYALALSASAETAQQAAPAAAAYLKALAPRLKAIQLAEHRANLAESASCNQRTRYEQLRALQVEHVRTTQPYVVAPGGEVPSEESADSDSHGFRLQLQRVARVLAERSAHLQAQAAQIEQLQRELAATRVQVQAEQAQRVQLSQKLAVIEASLGWRSVLALRRLRGQST